ncbi:hypothetical protein ABEY43_06810 [Priestia megaterium]
MEKEGLNVVDTALRIKNNKEIRDSYIDRIDVLDKVKELTVLPIVDCADTRQVCEYFDIKPITLSNAVKKFEEEFKADGVKKLTGTELGKFKSELYFRYQKELKARASLYLYPKRAVLRVAMLLDKSSVAKEVRNHLTGHEETLSPNEKDKGVHPHTKWTAKLERSIVESVKSKLESGKKITPVLKEVSKELDIPYSRLYSRWYNGSSKTSPLKLRLNIQDKTIKKPSNSIERIIEENNNSLIQKFEDMLNKQQEVIVNNLSNIWYKLDETKKQQEILVDDINMIKFDIAKIIQSINQNTSEEIKRVEDISKIL